MKFSATIEIGSEYDESEFNPEKVDAARKSRYAKFKEELQKKLEELIEDEFDYVSIKNVKISWDIHKTTK